MIYKYQKYQFCAKMVNGRTKVIKDNISMTVGLNCVKASTWRLNKGEVEDVLYYFIIKHKED